ncbi:MAG: hypothetical protein AUG49_00565 [Catenulispora sp. 13_1_20CM_3_70_7]|nr:MAG: hypothetical protein AUG49_00565 [Catenulispora sp. 13_1_20CM_3_70_7]
MPTGVTPQADLTPGECRQFPRNGKNLVWGTTLRKCSHLLKYLFVEVADFQIAALVPCQIDEPFDEPPSYRCAVIRL